MALLFAHEVEGKPVLAIGTGLSPRSFAQSKLPQLLPKRGWVLRQDGNCEPWSVEGTLCITENGKETMAAYGQPFPGVVLLDAATGDDRESSWRTFHQCFSVLSRAARSLAIPAEDLTALAEAGPGSIVAGRDGSVLVFPSELFCRASGGYGEAADREARRLWTHPDCRTLEAARAIDFMAGTIAYRIIAGKAPFGFEGKLPPDEQLADNMRNRDFDPLELLSWEIRPAAAGAVTALVSDGLAASVDTLLAFGPDYAALVDPERAGRAEPAQFRANREAAARKRAGAADRRSFFRRISNIFMVGGGILAIVALLGVAWIQDLRSKPTTAGLEPQAVVSRFYGSVASLDQNQMDACTAKGVQTRYESYVMNLYIPASIREAYERKPGIVSPAELFAEGTVRGQSVFGITSLSIDQIAREENRAEYTVRFYLWTPYDEAKGQSGTDGKGQADSPEGNGQKLRLSVYECTDRLVLTRGKTNRWLIARWESESIAAAGPSADELPVLIADGSASSYPWAPAPEEILRASTEKGI